jgi:hypothetical protein
VFGFQELQMFFGVADVLGVAGVQEFRSYRR